jgi:SAM-dependent methyltransferase
MRLASQSDFYNGPIYTQYRHHEGYAKRARLFRYFPEPILVVGCGFGFLVTEFLRVGRRAAGIDAAVYAIERKDNDAIFWASVLDIQDCRITLRDFLPFGTVITEDLLSYLTDEEATIAAINCSKLGPIVIHMVTEQGEAPQLNYHSTAEWMNLTSQLTVSLEGM